MKLEALALIVLAGIAGFAAVGGWIAHLKHRQPVEGLLLGGVLGPVGLVLELRKPCAHRPMVDPGAWDSFRSLVNYQSNPRLPQLPAPTTSQRHR